MTNLLTGLQTGASTTANGAVTNSSSLNDCLDFFFLAGASRTMSIEDKVGMFSRAFNQDRATALKVLFWSRDVRGGAGERQLFRDILKYLAKNHTDIYRAIEKHIPEYGRWDDLFYDMTMYSFSEGFIKESIKNITDLPLLAKWLPREKSSKKDIAKEIRRVSKMTPKEYRHMLAENSMTVENQMCDNQWDEIKFKGVPSQAFKIYSAAFMKHDEERFTSFLGQVEEGTETINAGAIFPMDLYKKWEGSNGGGGNPVNSTTELQAINGQWDNLPDYMNDENILPVCDVSGSMNGDPMAVSISLGVYLSERTKGIFKDHFITFSARPTLQKLTGKVTDRFLQLRRANWDMNTDLVATFKLILDVALRDDLKQSDLPSKVLIISDMEFDYCSGSETNMEFIQNMFTDNGYECPGLIFWNVRGRIDNSPAQQADRNVGLVSGYSPSIMTSILGGQDFSPVGIMNTTLEKYNFIDKI